MPVFFLPIKGYFEPRIWVVIHITPPANCVSLLRQQQSTTLPMCAFWMADQFSGAWEFHGMTGENGFRRVAKFWATSLSIISFVWTVDTLFSQTYCMGGANRKYLSFVRKARSRSHPLFGTQLTASNLVGRTATYDKKSHLGSGSGT